MNLNEQREKLVHDAREALDEITNNTDESRATELEQRHDAIMADYDKVESAIEREARQAKIEARAEEARAANRPINRGGEERQNDGAPEYRATFYKLIANGGDVSELSSEERSVLKAGVSEFRAQTAGTTTAGGYTVPVELSAEIVKSMAATGPMYGDIARVLTTSGGNQINIPTVNDTSVTAVAHTEAAALTDDGGSDVTFGQKRLDAYVYDTEFLRFSMELAQDSILNVESLLGTLLGERLGKIANAQLTTGTGSSAPNGVVTASSLGVTAAATAAVTADELIDLVHSVDPAYRAGAAFMFNDSTLKAIRKLKDGDGNYLWSMGNVQQGVPGSLLGYNYYVNQAMDSLAAAKKIAVFGDFKKYIVRKVGAPVIGVMRERFWPDLGIAGLIRFDGELMDTAAMKHLITAAS